MNFFGVMPLPTVASIGSHRNGLPLIVPPALENAEEVRLVEHQPDRLQGRAGLGDDKPAHPVLKLAQPSRGKAPTRAPDRLVHNVVHGGSGCLCHRLCMTLHRTLHLPLGEDVGNLAGH
jgi:hypothetical protein